MKFRNCIWHVDATCPSIPTPVTTLATTKSPDRPGRSAACEQTLRLLARLAALLGRELEASRAVAAMDLVDSDDPLELACAGAAAIGVRVEPRRLAVADAVWIAGDMLPVVAWSASQQRWLAFTGHGFFSARCWSSAEPDSEARTMSVRPVPSVPAREASSASVPCATTLPPASTKMRSQVSLISPRMWLERSTVQSLARLRMT